MALQTAEPQQLSRLTVLRSGGESAPILDTLFTADQGKKSIEVAKDLRKIQPEGGKPTMRAALAVKDGETLFNPHNAINFINRFGGEHKGSVANMTPEERASYQKAKDIIRQNNTLTLFLQAKALPATERNAYINRLLSEYGDPASNYDAIRKKALESVANSSAFIALFPEVANQLGGRPAILNFIEDTLMPSDDQRLASRLGTRMHDAYKKAVGFELVMTDEKKAELEEQKKVEEARYDSNVKKLKALLIGRGLTKPGGGQIAEADVKGWLASAGTPEIAGDIVASNILGKPINELVEVKRFRIDLPREISILEDSMKTKLAAAGVPDIAAYILAKPGEKEVIDYQVKVGEKNALAVNLNPGGVRAANLTDFDTKLLSMYQDGSLGGLASGAKQSDLKLEDLHAQITARPATTAEIEKSRDLRILQEEDLLGEIDGILGQSIADVLEERYDVMEERMGRKMENDAKNAEKNVAILTDYLKRKMSTNWIEYNVTRRKKEPHKDQIKKDVTHLAYAYDKDMALKQLIARDLFAGRVPNLSTANFQQLNLITGDVGANNALSEEQLGQVNEIFKQSGTDYRNKLFADMFAARTFGDKNLNLFGVDLWQGTLGFKRDEWKYMMQRYEPDITKALEANQEASAALKGLEAQGVKVDFNMKWLYYILAVVLGVGAGAAGLPAGIGIAKDIGQGIMAGGAVTEQTVGAIAGGLGGAAAMKGFSQN